MRIILLVFLLCAVSFSASAQFWNRIFKPKRYPLLSACQYQDFKMPDIKLNAGLKDVKRMQLGTTDYYLVLNEQVVMKEAQHHMRFREYEEASYSFNQLAKIYQQLNKHSEAKWFFLQSNNLSRQQSNDHLTINNLINLALVKSAIGDFELAQQDLEEAHTMANLHGWQDDLAAVNKEIINLKRNRIAVLIPPSDVVTATQRTL